MIRRYGITTSDPRVKRRAGDTDRRGVLLVVVLACILIVSLLTASLLKGAKQWRRQVRTESRFAQAEWLVESGLNKAISRLEANQNYTGETWQLSSDDGLRYPATITITIKRTGKTQTIRVNANYKTGFEDGIRAKRTLTLTPGSGAETND